MINGVSPDLPHTADLPPAKEWGLRLFRVPVRLLLHSWWRVRVHGREHVPDRGPVILAANHLGVLDGPALVAVTRRRTFTIAKVELFSGLGGRLLTYVGQLPVNRRVPDGRAIGRAVQVLRAGKVLAVFPEGRRTGGEVAYARGGAAYLAMVTGASVVPVALLGTREPGQGRNALPHRRSPVHVVYGEPFTLPLTPWPRTRAAVADATEELRRRLAEHVVAAQGLTGLPLPGPPKP
ncbi:lysophospholipid acyltransferase family protein [uncultured Friedmanniella sp.]|uniref:lysophospholipid acyltransferase family protein n=1 Tax=uncultured Friedmanniella sp. TaxID=335381 RepID=UPI0035CB1355